MIISHQPIFNISNTSQKKQNNSTNKINFTANPNSTILQFNPKDFFINIKGYGKDIKWAEKVIQITDNAVENITVHRCFIFVV